MDEQSTHGKAYFILDGSSGSRVTADAIPLLGSGLRALVEQECFGTCSRCERTRHLVDRALGLMGFEWDPLSEPGHMRKLPFAVTMTEAIEKRAWRVAERFCAEQGITLNRLSAGELLSPGNPDLTRPLALISRSKMYGTGGYRVEVEGSQQLLRYSACLPKLSIAKAGRLGLEDLPFGLFEVSKSYRLERSEELRLCERVRTFQIPELHVLSDGLDSSLRLTRAAHELILEVIAESWHSCEILCSSTTRFFSDQRGYLQELARSISRPILVGVQEDGELCGNGLEFEIEYKVIDGSGWPVEIATLQVDDGSSAFSFDVGFLTDGTWKPISTLHAVFLGSIERAAYGLIERSVDRETGEVTDRLPFWAAPIQVRVVPQSREDLVDALRVCARLGGASVRADVDDRDLPFEKKWEAPDLAWIPFVVTVGDCCGGTDEVRCFQRRRTNAGFVLSLEGLCARLRALAGDVAVPRYSPALVSKRALSASGACVR